MHHITLVYSIHKKVGRCTSDALCSIIKGIQPDVIFEETPEDLFYKAYQENNHESLEIKAIKTYMKMYNVEHIPVDTYPLPEKYHEENNRLLDVITNTKRILPTRTLRDVIDQYNGLLVKYGFDYLNDQNNKVVFKEIARLEEAILKELNDSELYRIYYTKKDIIDKRELRMIENIYQYSQANAYDKAIMFIGSGHSLTLPKVIQSYNDASALKLNWINLYGQQLI